MAQVQDAGNIQVVVSALFAPLPPASMQVDSLLEQLDTVYAALSGGRMAGFHGLVRGENPHMAPALRRAWDLGWAQGDSLRLGQGERVVVLH